MYFNVILLTKLSKLGQTKIITIIRPQNLNFPTSLNFQEIFKLIKLNKIVNISSRNIYPCPC